MKKILKSLLVFLFIFIICGCSNKKSERIVKCTLEQNNVAYEYKLSSEYNIYTDGNIVNKVETTEIATSNKQEILDSLENYNNTLSYLYDNVKSFKHDFNNMIFIIGGFINTNDMDGLKRYYIDLEKDCERVNSIEILNPKIINNPGIYNLLVAKYNKAEQENVKISLEFFFDFERLHMPFYDFTRMLGILLDNAIEAAAECEEKQVNIMFRDSSKHKTQIIKIENTYLNKDVDISQIFEKGITEKENHMGMGLWEINQIVKRNNNIKLLTTKNEKYFVQQLEIYY